MHPGYERRIEAGAVHVFHRDLVKDSRNPLNITSSLLNSSRNSGVCKCCPRSNGSPEQNGIALSVLGYPGEPIFPFGAQRRILLQSLQ
jgi:hypothetical protein